MAIIVDNDTRLVVQGITGREGSFHTLRNRRYGTNVVAGVTPGKGGQDVEGIPVFDTVADAVAETQANTTMIFVPARFAADAIYESVDAGIGTVICIAEGLPAHEMLRIYNYIRPRGITRCDEVARGILQALGQMTIEHPIVVRLDGTNAEEGRRILADAAPSNLHVEPTMLDAARRAVELAEAA